MNTRFTALTIQEGDAFLLEDNGWNCLFDSGKDESIVDLLKYKGIEKLDLAICSHNDSDHTNGFIELLKSGFKIDEIWLPGLWASVLQYVKENGISDDEAEFEDGYFDGELESLYSKESVPCDSFDQELSFWEKMKDSEDSSQVYERLHKKLAHRVTRNPIVLVHFLSKIIEAHFSEGYDGDYSEAQLKDYLEDLSEHPYDLFPRHMARILARRLVRHPLSHSNIEASLMDVFGDPNDRNFFCYGLKRSIDIKLNRIMNIIVLARQCGCTIRWFEPTSACSINNIDYGFVSLNSSKIGKIKKPKNSVAYFYALSLTKENRYSLVFEYTKNKVPLIRFSADSNSTCQSVSPYPENIIVTAPHHGSGANSVVYRRLTGNDIIWVRSDERSGKRPCLEFKLQPNKYCLACNKFNFVSEICFEYYPWDHKWHHVHGEQCRCK